jgi:hypothetical protein
MKKFSTFAIFSALALVAAFSPAPLKAQSSAPVLTKQVPAKPVWLKGEVLHCDAHSVVVREADHERDILTFTYTPKAQAQIQTVLDKGGFQHGDSIRIRYMQGSSVALAIGGKPSKPLNRPTSTSIRPTPSSTLH